MIDNGWIKVHRKITESGFYFREKFCRNMAWIDLLILANHADNSFRCRGILVEVKRGQVGYSIDNLCKRWRWSKGKVLRFLNELETEHQIVKQNNNVTTLLSIVNYDQYQSHSTANGTPNSKPNSKTNSKTNGTQTRMNKNEEEVNTDTNVSGDVPELSLQERYYELQKTFAERPTPEIGLELKTFLTNEKPDFAEPLLVRFGLARPRASK